jgi:hypothetical protein
MRNRNTTLTPSPAAATEPVVVCRITFGDREWTFRVSPGERHFTRAPSGRLSEASTIDPPSRTVDLATQGDALDFRISAGQMFQTVLQIEHFAAAWGGEWRRCTCCEVEFDRPEDMITHLASAHDMEFHDAFHTVREILKGGGAHAA